MSGTNDKNWKSYVGPQDNGRTVTPVEWSNPVVPSDWDDIFKCSHVDNLTASELTIVGGSREDSVDAVGGNNYRWLFCKILGAVTLKGALTGWTFEGGSVTGKIVVGQFDKYWYLGRKPTSGGHIRAVTKPGNGTIEVELWDADEPEVYASNVHVRKIPVVIWLPYFCYRYVWIRLVALVTRKPI